jgi:DNA-binding NarL/FixJ family response regulator
MKPAPPVTKTRLAMVRSRLRVSIAGAAGNLTLDSGSPLARDFTQSPVRVVIVDDHRLFVDALALLLGHDERLEVIGTASDGPTAIDLAVDGKAEVAVIDVRMPEVDGIETAKRLKKRSPETRVILVTGLDEPQIAEQAQEAGAVALLKKGALHDQLKEAIITAVSSQRVTAN